MAEKNPEKPNRKRKPLFEVVERKRETARERSRVSVCLGDCFERWRALKVQKNLKTDALVAKLLLDSYDNITSTPLPHGLWVRPQPPVSTIMQESLTDRDDDFSVKGVEKLSTSSSNEELDSHQQEAAGPSISRQEQMEDVNEQAFNSLLNATVEWDNDDDDDEDQTWTPQMETLSMSTSEEDETKEFDSDSDDSKDLDYVPPICLRAGGALKKRIEIEELPEVSTEETVLDQPHSSDKQEEIIPPVNAMVITEEDVLDKPASIVYHDVLKQLLEFLRLPIDICKAKDSVTKEPCNAAAPFEVSVKCRCTAVIAEWICPNGHTVWRWSSQRYFKYGMLAGDFMLGCNILLSGNNYRKIALMFKFMNMGIMDPSTYYKIQDGFCVDNIKAFWKSTKRGIINELKTKESIVLLGDARMDSPGFCAQYCTYTMMENDSKKIVHTHSTDKRYTQRNSVVMEKACFIKCMDAISEELKIDEVCTDAHSQISALFQTGEYKDRGIKHSLDIWHGAKNLSKRIAAAGREKQCKILLNWTQDITNHFWYCCRTAETYGQFMDLWQGVLHHVTGEHEWFLGSCRHGPYNDKDKSLISKGSVAHKRLRDLVLDARWLKTVTKYLYFRSTSDLESFHNHILMYAAKRFHFTDKVYKARVYLATLDYNHHLDRPLKRKKDGSVQKGKIYSKRTKMWRLYSYKVPKDYKYIPDLQAIILRTRIVSKGGMAKSHPFRPDDPRKLGTLAGGPTPTIEELEEQQVSRGLRKPTE